MAGTTALHHSKMANTDLLSPRNNHNNFCLEIFRPCVDTQRNMIVGVNSIARSLWLQYLGVDDETREQFNDGEFSYISQGLPSSPGGGHQSFSNIFSDEDLGELSPAYLTSINDKNVRCTSVSPSNLEEKVRDAKKWLTESSGGQVTKCISSGVLSKFKLCFASNSVFRGEWRRRFDVALITKKFNFMSYTTLMYADSSTVCVSTLESMFNATIAIFPYRNGCSLLVLMPHMDHSFAALTSLIHDISENSHFNDILSSFEEKKSNVQAMPMFSFSSSLPLNSKLNRIMKLRRLISAPNMSKMFQKNEFSYEDILHFNETSITNTQRGTVAESMTTTGFVDGGFDGDTRDVVIDAPFVFITLDTCMAIVDTGIFIGGDEEADVDVEGEFFSDEDVVEDSYSSEIDSSEIDSSGIVF